MMMLSLEDCTGGGEEGGDSEEGGGADGGDSEEGGVAEASGAGANSLTPGEGPLPLSKRNWPWGEMCFVSQTRRMINIKRKRWLTSRRGPKAMSRRGRYFIPQDGQQGYSKAKRKENNRWKRWQQLSRKTGEEEDLDEIAKFPSPDNSPERETNYSNDPPGKEDSVRPTSRLSNVSSTASFSQQQPPQETSQRYEQQQQHKGISVTVKTYECEEVGILARDNNLVILFNINQVIEVNDIVEN